MKNKFKLLKNIIATNKFIQGKILKKKYIRTGSCKGCGKCCTHIYVKHGNGFIKNEEEFEGLKPSHFFYKNLIVIGKDETGLIFECTKLDKETRKCTDHKHRALICRSYPQEEIFMMGGTLSEDCGFKFTPIESFEDVFKKIKKKKAK